MGPRWLLPRGLCWIWLCSSSDNRCCSSSSANCLLRHCSTSDHCCCCPISSHCIIWSIHRIHCWQCHWWQPSWSAIHLMVQSCVTLSFLLFENWSIDFTNFSHIQAE